MTDEEPDVPSAEEFADRIRGRSDKEIVAAVERIGTEEVLARVFDRMPERFHPELAGAREAQVQWTIRDKKVEHRYVLTVGGGVCSVGPGDLDAPDLTMGLSVPDFLRFVVGELDGPSAFIDGRLTLDGDLILAQEMREWFVPE